MARVLCTSPPTRPAARAHSLVEKAGEGNGVEREKWKRLGQAVSTQGQRDNDERPTKGPSRTLGPGACQHIKPPSPFPLAATAPAIESEDTQRHQKGKKEERGGT